MKIVFSHRLFNFQNPYHAFFSYFEGSEDHPLVPLLDIRVITLAKTDVLDYMIEELHATD